MTGTCDNTFDCEVLEQCKNCQYLGLKVKKQSKDVGKAISETKIIFRTLHVLYYIILLKERSYGYVFLFCFSLPR
jgi:hypothetical protein